MANLAYLPSALGLGVVLFAAARLTRVRPVIRVEAAALPRFLLVSSVTTATQALHFVEEWQTGFAVAFPGAFGLPAIPQTVFVTFNVVWLGIWLLAITGVRRGVSIALWPLWFLGLAAVLNGIAHPVLALRLGTYFPGLVSAPVLGVLGGVLLRELFTITSETPRPD